MLFSSSRGCTTRFLKAGYTDPKPLIDIAGIPLIHHLAEKFPKARWHVYEPVDFDIHRQAASLKVFAADGRLVATLFDGVAEAGVTTSRWSGLDATGHALAPGLYFARLTTGGATEVSKLLLIR